jgi:hypothetical protein
MLVELEWCDDELRAGILLGDGRTRSSAIAYGMPLFDLARERGFAVFYTGAEEAPARRFPPPAPAAIFDVTAPLFRRAS